MDGPDLGAFGRFWAPPIATGKGGRILTVSLSSGRRAMAWDEEARRHVFRLYTEGKPERDIVKEVREAHGCDDKTVRRCIVGVDILTREGRDEEIPDELTDRYERLKGTASYLADLRRAYEAFGRPVQAAHAQFDAVKHWERLTPDLLDLVGISALSVHDFDLATFYSRPTEPSWPIPKGQVVRGSDGTLTVVLTGEDNLEWAYLRKHLQTDDVWEAIEKTKRALAHDLSVRLGLLEAVVKQIQKPSDDGGCGLIVVNDVRDSQVDEAVDLYYAFTIYDQILSRCLGLPHAPKEQRDFMSDEPNIVYLGGRPVLKTTDETRRQRAVDYLLWAQTGLMPLAEESGAPGTYRAAEQSVEDLRRHVNRLRLAAGFPPGSTCDGCRLWV